MNFDGFADYYYSSHEDRFPSIGSLVEDSVRFTSCYSSIPSITVPMQTALVSGCTSAGTHNCFKYYDRESHKIVKSGRRVDSQTIAELYKKNGKSVLSIQQFAVENHGCTRDDKDHLYIQPEEDFEKRFDILLDYYRNCRVPGFDFSDYRDLVLFYIDDLDSDGHNHHAPFAVTEEDRVEKVRKKLELIDVKVGELIALLKEKGLYEKTTILLTADHGMVGFESPSILPALCNDLSRLLDLRVTTDVEEVDESDVLVIGDTIQAQVYFRKGLDIDQEKLKKAVEALDYVEIALTRAELDEREVAAEYADFVISPNEGKAFFVPDSVPSGIRFASHDSINEKAQHVFALIHYPGMTSSEISKNVSIIDLVPTCLKLLGEPKLANSTGEILL